jgi:CBS domain-containing protein
MTLRDDKETVMNVGEICSREVVIANRGDSVLDAARLMREHHVGDVVVVDQRDGQRVPVGILTDRDIVLELVAKSVDAQTVTVADAMTGELLIAAESDDVGELIEHMKGRGVRRVPVVNAKGGLVGIVAVDDLMDLLAEQLAQLAGLVKREERSEQTRRPLT